MNFNKVSDFVDRNADHVFVWVAVFVTAAVVVAEFAIGAFFTDAKSDLIFGVLPSGRLSTIAVLALIGFLFSALAGRFALFHIFQPLRRHFEPNSKNPEVSLI